MIDDADDFVYVEFHPYVEVTKIDKKEIIKTNILDEEFLRSRIYIGEKRMAGKKKKYIPPPGHPWRHGWRNKDVTFQISNNVTLTLEVTVLSEVLNFADRTHQKQITFFFYLDI